MKITLTALAKNGAVGATVSLDVAVSETGDALADDIPVQIEGVGQRYVYAHHNASSNNLTFSLRRRPLKGHQEYYGEVVDFDAYVPLRRFPVAFLFRESEATFIKVTIETATS